MRMDERLKEIIAAVDLILGDLDRVKPATCQDAVEMNWRLRKLSLARGLLQDTYDSPQMTPRVRMVRMAPRRALRVE